MDIFSILLALHITGGGISLLTGGYLLATPKGTRRHKRLGKVYFYAMLTAAFVALPMSVIHPNYFLFIIAVFTAYMLLSGIRFLQIKSPADVSWYDWALWSTMLVAGLAFIGFGLFNLIKGKTFGVVFLFFGLIGFTFLYHDYRTFKGKNPIRNFYLTTHLQRMMGSYIASTTAFLVVNNTVLPPIAAWLLPSLIIAPLIRAWTLKHKILKNPTAPSQQ